MCNICINSLVFASRNLVALKKLHKIILNLSGDETTNSVANLLRAHSYTEHDVTLLCDKRDYVSYVEKEISSNGPVFCFGAETCSAWSENLECLHTLLSEKYSNIIRLYAQSEEEGMGIYSVADPAGIFLRDKFKVDTYLNGDYITQYFSSYADVISFLQGKFPKLSFCVFDAPEDVEQVIRDTLDYDTEDFFNLHVFEEYSEDGTRLSKYYYETKEAA